MADATSLGLRDPCAIVGIGATDFSQACGRSEPTVAEEASLSIDCGYTAT